jgi:hypothetical protein
MFTYQDSLLTTVKPKEKKEKKHNKAAILSYRIISNKLRKVEYISKMYDCTIFQNPKEHIASVRRISQVRSAAMFSIRDCSKLRIRRQVGHQWRKVRANFV